MRKYGILLTILAIGLTSCAPVDVQTPPPVEEQLDPETKARQQAGEMHEGDQVYIRIYPDYTRNPGNYTLSRATVTDLQVTRTALRIACLSDPEFANAVNIPAEQMQLCHDQVETAHKEIVTAAAAVQKSVEEALQLAASIRRLLPTPTRYSPQPATSALSQATVALRNVNQKLEKLVKLTNEAQAIIGDIADPGADNNLVAMLMKSEQIDASITSMRSNMRNMTQALNGLINTTLATKQAMIGRIEANEALYVKERELIRSIDLTVRGLTQLRSATDSVLTTLVRLRGFIEAIEGNLDVALDSAVIVVAPDDQKNAILSDCILVRRYDKATRGISLSIPSSRRKGHKPCMFTDADYQPIADTPVEIRLGQYNYPWDPGPRITVKTVMLDEKGQTNLPIVASELPTAIYVIHKDCGPVYAKDVSNAYLDPNETYRRFHVPLLPKDKWTVFVDALHEPIANATVAIYRGQTYARREHPDPVGTYELDTEGRLKPPRERTRLWSSCFVVSHPDYGIAIAEPRSRFSTDIIRTCPVPLVRTGTDARARSIWGTVVDPNGKPVVGAILECRGISTPGGGYLKPSTEAPSRVITDMDGSFSICLPLAQTYEDERTLVPLASVYPVTVKATGGLSLKKRVIRVKAGVETTITLHYPVALPRYFHTFSFENEGSSITKDEDLMRIRMAVTPTAPGHSTRASHIEYKQWKDGGMFPLGRFSAYLPGRPELLFEPVMVTKESPEHIVFHSKPPDAREFCGSIINAATGEPVEDAIIFLDLAMTGQSQINFTPEQWQGLRNIASQSRVDNTERPQLLNDLRLHFEAATVPDSTGSYRIGHVAAQRPMGPVITVLKQGFLGSRFLTQPSMGRKKATRPDNDVQDKNQTDGCVRIPTLAVFPKAHIVVEPNLPFDPRKERPQIDVSWKVDPNEDPLLASRLTDYYRKGGTASRGNLRPNRKQTIPVPAGVRLSLTVAETRMHKCQPLLISDIKVDQGKVLDLGKLTFEPRMRISLHLVDSDSHPIKGVAVHAIAQIDGLRQPPQKGITDKNGNVWFDVLPNSSVRFEVRHQPQSDDAQNTRPGAPIVEFVEHQVVGPQDEDKEFTFKLSDKMMLLLFQ